MVTKEWQVFAKLQKHKSLKDSKLAFFYLGNSKYEENLIDSIYETEKNKSLVSTTPLSTAFFSTSIVQYFQDIPDDEEDTRSNHEYLNDLEEEYQARALLAKSKRFFKKGTQRSVHTGVERPWFSKAEGFILPNHDTGKILPTKSQRNITDPSVAVTDSSATDYDSTDESLVCSTPLPPLKKLDGVEPISGPKTIKSILRGETLQAKKAEALKSTKAESSNANRSKTPTKSGCSRHMTGVKSYLHKYVEQPGPKVVFGDDSTCTTKGYGSIKCNDIVFTKSFFFAKAFENLNWLWHKRLAHLNFKTINKLAKQNLVIALPSLVYSKDKPCSSCEKGNHHRASFKTKQTSSIKKCLRHLHMDLFRLVTPRSINHEKYTLVTVDEYSRYTWVYFLKKKSQALETIMSFIKRVENQNDIKVKQLRTDIGTKFRNSILVNFCDEKGISQNFSSPYTPKQNGVVERKNRTFIKAARTMLSGSVFSKQYWTEVVAITCYTQNISTIVKRHLKTPYEIFRKRIPNINFLYVFGYPVYIHIHKDHLGKFDEKADDGYILGYSLVSKALKVFNTRRKQTKETYHITFNESPNAIKFSKPSVENINIAENERYPPDEYLHPYEPSQRYQTNNNDVSFIEPYESTELTDEILNDNLSEHFNHNNDEQIIDNLPNTKDIQISEHLSSPNVEDTSVQDTISIPNPLLPIPSMVTPAHQDRWSQEKHHVLIFSLKKNLKKISEALKHPGWLDAMQDELNTFSRNKVWTLVPTPNGKTIIGSKWVFRNKRDETRIVIKNKARLVAQGYNQQEGIDYDETFAPCMIEATIRNFCHMPHT
ncbi:retrovirus-related pol polyprotein from transposon TNT 1-94 [Tanacetum coccineum]